MMSEDKLESSKKFNKLIKKIAKGDKQALCELYSGYNKLLSSAAWSVCRSHCLADEIVDDVLAKIWLAAKTLKKIENPAAWLCTVTKRCAIDRIKKEKQSYEFREAAENDPNMERLETDDAFYFYISRLNEEEQQIFILRFAQGLPFKQISKEIDKPLSTVTSIFYRAIEKLRPFFK